MSIDIKSWLKNLPIKTRLLYGYLLTILPIVLISSCTLYLNARNNIIHDLERELTNSTISLQRTVETATKATTISQLKTSTEKNTQILSGIYQQSLKESTAKKRSGAILNSQSIGKNGYLYVFNSEGIIQVHPNQEMIGRDISDSPQISQMIHQKYGFFEFEQPATENTTSEKWLSYVTYFGPWDWIISATVEKSDFIHNIELEDLSKSVLARQFGKTGYSFILDRNGTFLVHTKLEGKKITDQNNPDGERLLEQMWKMKNGKLTYQWKNPGEYEPRSKIVYFAYIPELQWIVASSAYLDEYYQPLRSMLYIIIFTLLLTVSLIGLLTWQLGNSITHPIKYLNAGLKAVSSGDFSKRLFPKYSDELGRLEAYFNTFITQLQSSREQLESSEKGFRAIFENSVEGIFQFDMDGNLLKVNPSFVSMIGHNSSQSLLEEELNFKRDVLVKKELWNELLEKIISDKTVKGLEIQIRRKSGAVFWCLLNARGVHGPDGDTIIKIEGFLSDIDAKKVAQEGQEKILEDLESMVSERTIELSAQIAELELRNQLNRALAEMADMLQSCRAVEETYPVIKQYLQKLFPGDQCALFLHDDKKQLIDRVIPAATSEDPFNSMTNESCWALRQGKSYLFNDMEQELVCDHVDNASNGYLCIPLIAHGVTIGLLHIIFSQVKLEIPEQFYAELERKKRLSSRLGEHLSLALANLKLQEELKLKSIQDALTGLANRRHMEEIMQRQFYRLLRYNTPCSVIMLDVDHFKKFNDTYGHDMGDFVLQELAAYLKENTRGEDLACRYGGEEFIIIMVNTDTDKAVKKAHKMCKEIAEVITIPHLSETLHVTVSMGVATSPKHGRNTTELLKSADTALYLAKENGRNRVELAKTGE